MLLPWLELNGILENYIIFHFSYLKEPKFTCIAMDSLTDRQANRTNSITLASYIRGEKREALTSSGFQTGEYCSPEFLPVRYPIQCDAWPGTLGKEQGVDWWGRWRSFQVQCSHTSRGSCQPGETKILTMSQNLDTWFPAKSQKEIPLIFLFFGDTFMIHTNTYIEISVQCAIVAIEY